MIDKNDILRKIEQHKDRIKEFGVTEIGVLGSYVRGEQTISWSEMAKRRDRIIYHYEGIDYEIVWNTITNDIPELNFRIEEILKQHK